jgi:hypothetical protein
MSSILSQISYPVFLYCVFVFFIIASIFSFVVGVSFAVRNATMLRLFEFMNESYSVRRAMKPLEIPRFIDPVLLKRPKLLGVGIILGAAMSIYLLMDVDEAIFQPMFLGPFSYFSAVVLAGYTKSFLLVGNAVCAAVGLMMLFLPRHLSGIASYANRWYTLRKQSFPLSVTHHSVDKWVLAHPTVSGVTLSIMSMGLFVSMYARI